MQILARAGEDLPFFTRRVPRVASSGPPSCDEAQSNIPETPSLAPLDFVSKATSGAAAALRNASSRARKALVDLKDDLVGDIMVDFAAGGLQQQPSQQSHQHSSQFGQGWGLPWAVKSEGDRLRDETRKKLRDLAKVPSRFLVPRLRPHVGLAPEQEGELGVFAAAALEEDACLRRLRDEVVPRMVSESEFWDRYFVAVRDINDEVSSKLSQAAGQVPVVLTTPLTSACTATSSSSSMNSVASGVSQGFSGLTGARVISPVRPFNVDDSEGSGGEEEHPIPPRCQSERLVTSESPLSLCHRCTSEGGPANLQPVCSCSGHTDIQPPAVGSVTGLLRQLSSTSADDCGQSSSGGRREGDEDVDGGAVLWIRRTVSGVSAALYSSPGDLDGPELHGPQHPQVFQEGLPSSDALPIAVKRLPLDEMESYGMSMSAALHHLASGYCAATGYATCAELLVMDLQSVWPKLNPLAAVAEGFRRPSNSGSQSSTSPQRWGVWDLGPTPDGFSARHEDPATGRLVAQSNLVASIFTAARSGSTSGGKQSRPTSCFSRSLHGAPQGSLVAHLARSMARLDSVQAMSQLWLDFVHRVRDSFKAGEELPGVPCAECNMGQPDLQLCELMQHLQLLNLAMERRRRRRLKLAQLKEERGKRTSGTVSPEGVSAEARSLHGSEEPNSEAQALPSTALAVEMGSRRGVKEVTSGMLLLLTGEPLCIPETQETPLMTESSVQEQEEQIIRTGTMGSGCEQLFSDMQAFKAANPGCLLEDFVRWYSPPDWSPVPYSPSAESNVGSHSSRLDEMLGAAILQEATSTDVVHPSEQDLMAGCSKRGYLSIRMTFSGNMWQELWAKAGAVPAIEQPQLYDVELGGENSLSWLEDLPPSDLLEQLFITLLGLGLGAAHECPEAAEEPLRTSLTECTRYITASCSKGMGQRKQDMLCAMFEVLEAARVTALGAMQARGVRGISSAEVAPLDVGLAEALVEGGANGLLHRPAAVEMQSEAAGDGLHNAKPPVQEPPTETAVSMELECCKSEVLLPPLPAVGAYTPTSEVDPRTWAPVVSLPMQGKDCTSSMTCGAGGRWTLPTGASVGAATESCHELLSGESGLARTSFAEEKEDATSSIRQAAASILQKMNPGTSWPRPFRTRPSARHSQGGQEGLCNDAAPPVASSSLGFSSGLSSVLGSFTPKDSRGPSPLRGGVHSDLCSPVSTKDGDGLVFAEEVLTPRSTGWISTGLSERLWGKGAMEDPETPSLVTNVHSVEDLKGAQALSTSKGAAKPLWKLGEKSFGKLFGAGSKETSSNIVQKEKEVEGEWVLL